MRLLLLPAEDGGAGRGGGEVGSRGGVALGGGGGGGDVGSGGGGALGGGEGGGEAMVGSWKNIPHHVKFKFFSSAKHWQRQSGFRMWLVQLTLQN